LRADAVVAANRTDRPWLLIDAKLIPSDAEHIYPSWIQQIQAYKVVSDSEFAILLTPYFLAILQNPPKEFLLRQYSLKHLPLEQASETYQLLARPAHLPGELSRPAPSNLIIDTDTFKIDLGLYSQLLESVFLAEKNDEKKKSLEQLAKELFESVPFLTCKHSNLRTASSEIDLVIQYRGSNLLTIFDEFGRHFLVECKNWKSSVGAAQVRDFLGKIQKSRIKLGIIFAKNGISGEASRSRCSARDSFSI
jgi:restriction endonuclease